MQPFGRVEAEVLWGVKSHNLGLPWLTVVNSASSAGAWIPSLVEELDPKYHAAQSRKTLQPAKLNGVADMGARGMAGQHLDMGDMTTCHLPFRGALWTNKRERWLLPDHSEYCFKRRALRLGWGPTSSCGRSSRPTPAPPVSHDDHAQLVPQVLHFVDLHERPRVVDLIQALDHVGLIAEGEGHGAHGHRCSGSLRSREAPIPALTSWLPLALWDAGLLHTGRQGHREPGLPFHTTSLGAGLECVF